MHRRSEVKPVSLVGMAAAANTGGKIGRGVPFKADGEDPPRRPGNAALEQVGGALRQ